MAFKTSSKQKISASSAVSSSSSGGVVISQVYITDASYVNSDDTAVGTSGGYLKLLGSGFVTGCVVYINNAAVTTTFVSSSEVRAVIPSAAAGTYSLTIFNTNSGGSIWASGLVFSGFPTVTTSSYISTLGAVVNTQIVATGDSTLSYSLQGGSTLPAGVTLSSTGLVSGTATGIYENTVVSFTVLVNDSQNQTVQQAITISLIFGDQYFKNTTALLSGDTFINTTDSSTNNFQVTAVGSPVATNLTPFQGSYSIYNSGAASGGGTINVTGTSGVFGSSTSYTIEGWFYFTAASTGDNQNIVATNTNTYPTRWIFDAGVTATSLQLRLVTETNALVFNGTSVTMSPLNTWVHLAVVNNVAGNACTFYINGVAAGTRVAVSLVSYATLNLFYNSPYITTAAPFYVSNFRIVSGTAVYTATFTPSTAPLTAITNTSLLTFQDNRIKDNSTNNFAITNIGAASISQRTPFEITPSVTLGSTSFNGSNQNFSITSNAALKMGTGNFTIEAWVYRITSGAYQIICIDGTTDGFNFRIKDTSKLQVGYDGFVDIVESTGNVPVNQWSHLAVTRSGTTVRLFINGVLDGTATGDSNNYNGAGDFLIGARSGSQHWMNGYISNLRVVKGTAVYTANFTPSTTPLTAITNTSLLTLQSPVPNNNNTFLDSSPNTITVARTGNVTQGSFSPFGSNWSLYTNGTSSYAYLPYNASRSIGTGDFSIECWIYISKQPANYSRVWSHQSNYGVAGSIGVELGFGTVDTVIQTLVDGNSQVYASATYDTTATGGSGHVRQWIHVVSSRQNGYLRLFVNGILREANVNSTNINGTSNTSFGTNSQLGGDLTELHMSNFRMCIGSVPTLYSTTNTTSGTTIFTPSTTPLTTSSQGATGVQLLLFQNNYIKDLSTNNFAVTTVGNPSISKFSPFSTTTGYVPSIHSGSMYFNGSTDKLTAATSPSYNMGSGDFTVECWLYWNGSSLSYQNFIGSNSAGFTGNSTFFRVWGSGGGTGTIWTKIGIGNPTHDGTSSVYSTNSLAVNSWTHVAATRSSGIIRVFMNGNLEKTGSTDTSTYDFGDNGLCIGASSWDGANGWYGGYISNARIVKGTALYTSAFTPSTTPLTAVTNTALLLNGTNAGVVDHSMQGNYITAGDSKISSATVKYGTGAMFFDGTGDYLLLANNPLNGKFGTGDFTVEYWDKHGTQGTCYTPQVGTLSSATLSGTWRFGTNSNLGALVFAVHNGTTYVEYSFGSTLYNDNVWRHFAIVRQSGILKAFVNGIQVGSNTAFTLDLNSNNNISVGAELVSPSGNTSFIGYIDDLRITKGIARYTANFTPEAQAFIKN